MLLLHGASSDACVCVSSTRGRGACRGVLNGNGDSNDEPHGPCWGVPTRSRYTLGCGAGSAAVCAVAGARCDVCVFMKRQVENTDTTHNILYSPYTAGHELRHTGLVKTSVTPPVLHRMAFSSLYRSKSSRKLPVCSCQLAGKTASRSSRTSSPASLSSPSFPSSSCTSSDSSCTSSSNLFCP